MMNDLLQFVEVIFFGIIAIKKWVVLSLKSFGVLKYDCVIETREMFNFLPLTNNSLLLNLAFCY